MHVYKTVVATLLALIAAQVPTVEAHALSTSYVRILAGPDGAPATVEVDLAIRDMALALPLDADRNEQVTWGELRSAQGLLEAMVLHGIQVSANAEPCQLVPGRLAIRRYDEGNYASLSLSAQCRHAGVVRVGYSLLFDDDPGHRSIVTLRAGESTASLVASANDRHLSFQKEADGSFRAFLRLGLQHILAGYDHLAFLMSLLMAACLSRLDGKWIPNASFSQSLYKIVGIVTAFTVAHSITLGLAALGLVRPASNYVEIVIAASVLLAAANNLYPIVVRRHWVIGFGFGLIHGFGFAGAVQQLGLPAGSELAAILAFNAGVELGQVGVVIAVLPVIFIFSGRNWYTRLVLPVGSLSIMGAAAYWMIQRL